MRQEHFDYFQKVAGCILSHFISQRGHAPEFVFLWASGKEKHPCPSNSSETRACVSDFLAKPRRCTCLHGCFNDVVEKNLLCRNNITWIQPKAMETKQETLSEKN